MAERRGFRQAISPLLSSLARLRMRVALAGAAGLFIAAIWIIILLRFVTCCSCPADSRLEEELLVLTCRFAE